MTNTTLLFLFLKALPAKFLKIQLVLWRYERSVQMKRCEAVYPTRETIAKEAGCSVDRVKQFNQYVSSLKDPEILTIKYRKNPKTKKNISNVYQIGEKLFDLITMLESLGYFRKWEKIKEEIYEKLSENDRFIHEIWWSKKNGCNQQITRGFSQKLPAILEPPIKEIKMSYGTLRNSAYYMSFFKEKGLGKKTARFIELFCSEDVLRQMRNDYDMYTKDNQIQFINGWIKDRALEYIPQQHKKAYNFFNK